MTKEIKRLVGRPTVYDPKYHPRMMQKFGRKGYTQVQCCAKFDIAEKTLYCWVKRHEEFKKSVELAQVYSASYWLDFARNWITETRTGKDYKRINVNLLIMLMRAHRMATSDRLLYLAFDVPGFTKAKTPADKACCVVNAACGGLITIKEAEQLLSTIERGLNIGEGVALLERMEKLEEVSFAQARGVELQARIAELKRERGLRCAA